MSDLTLPESTEDSGLTRFHSESLNDNEGILDDSRAVSIDSDTLKSWENRLHRVAGFIDKGESHKGVAAATEVRLEIRAARGASL